MPALIKNSQLKVRLLVFVVALTTIPLRAQERIVTPVVGVSNPTIQLVIDNPEFQVPSKVKEANLMVRFYINGLYDLGGSETNFTQDTVGFLLKFKITTNLPEFNTNIEHKLVLTNQRPEQWFVADIDDWIEKGVSQISIEPISVESPLYSTLSPQLKDLLAARLKLSVNVVLNHALKPVKADGSFVVTPVTPQQSVITQSRYVDFNWNSEVDFKNYEVQLARLSNDDPNARSTDTLVMVL